MFSTAAIGTATAGGVYVANLEKNESAGKEGHKEQNSDNGSISNANAAETTVERAEAVLVAEIDGGEKGDEDASVHDTQELTANNYMRYS